MKARENNSTISIVAVMIGLKLNGAQMLINMCPEYQFKIDNFISKNLFSKDQIKSVQCNLHYG